MNMKRLIKTKNCRGFTLIELMVSTSIFVVIMLAAMGALFILLDGAKNARALRISMDNVNFAMESMTRSIRMGNNYYCEDNFDSSIMHEEHGTKDCSEEGKHFIAFVPQEGFSNGRIGYLYKERDNETGVLQKCQGLNPNDCVDIVSSNIDVKKLKFFTFGSDVSDNKQAGVYIIMQGSFLVKEVEIDFSIQTITSMRNF